MKLRHNVPLIVLLLFVGCTPIQPPDTSLKLGKVRATILDEGYFDCFEKGLEDEKGRKVSCEISAVAFAGGQLDVGNDKSVPGGSPVMSVTWDGPKLSSSPKFVDTQVMREVRKIEAATTTPDEEWVVASTAFDRVKEDSATWNPFNTVLYWPAGQPQKARIAHASTIDGYASSISLRASIQKALADRDFPDGPPYFKIEALAAVPGGRLLFGVREFGKDYDTFSYCAKLISVGYRFEGDELILDEDFRMIYDGERLREMKGLIGPLGLSSLEYDRFNDRLYVLTTFENGEDDEDLGAYLWILSMESLNAGDPPTLVVERQGSPFLFAHKAEGMAVIDSDTLVFVHDDDRVFGDKEIEDPRREFHRKHHQSAWTVIRLQNL